MGCAVAVIGIQPSHVEFGEALSPPVARAVDEAAQLLRVLLDPAADDPRP
ncbi:MAG: hypothetical protein ACLQDL_05740 [Spirochaetia bacterium]